MRRVAADRSQQVRRLVQVAFLLLNAVIGMQFILWVRYFESGGTTHYFERPAGVDGWLPIAGLMNLRYFVAVEDLFRRFIRRRWFCFACSCCRACW